MGGAEGDSTTPEREVAGAGTRTAALPVPAAGWVQAEAEGVRLRALVGHAHAVPSSATVEDAVALFERHRIDFLAVVDAGKGTCKNNFMRWSVKITIRRTESEEGRSSSMRPPRAKTRRPAVR